MALDVTKEEFVLRFMIMNDLKLFEKAYRFAEKCHNGHTRNDGTPYIGHPNEICYVMILLGITDERWLSVAICHDIVEELFFKDNIVLTRREIAKELGSDIAMEIYTLSRLMKEGTRWRFKRIEKKAELVIIKTIDRFVNMNRSMIGFYAKERLERYIFETEEYILPMSERIINSGKFPEYENALRTMRLSIKGLLRGAKEHVELMRLKEEIENGAK